jgi:hypothetical protein
MIGAFKNEVITKFHCAVWEVLNPQALPIVKHDENLQKFETPWAPTWGSLISVKHSSQGSTLCVKQQQKTTFNLFWQNLAGVTSGKKKQTRRGWVVLKNEMLANFVEEKLGLITCPPHTQEIFCRGFSWVVIFYACSTWWCYMWVVGAICEWLVKVVFGGPCVHLLG